MVWGQPGQKVGKTLPQKANWMLWFTSIIPAMCEAEVGSWSKATWGKSARPYLKNKLQSTGGVVLSSYLGTARPPMEHGPPLTPVGFPNTPPSQYTTCCSYWTGDFPSLDMAPFYLCEFLTALQGVDWIPPPPWILPVTAVPANELNRSPIPTSLSFLLLLCTWLTAFTSARHHCGVQKRHFAD
jgi:hypothetical protein